MRNVKIIIFTIFFIWLIPQVSLAESRPPENSLAPLILTFGKTIASPPVRGVVKDDHIYLNLPFLYEYLNIVATRNIRNGEIFLQFGKVSIKLYANDPAYYLNGKRLPLPVSPFEEDDQFWTPLEFLLKLGLIVTKSDAGILALDWDGNYLLDIESIQYENHQAILFIGSVKLEAGNILTAPDGVSFELMNTAKHFSLDEKLKNNPIISGVRFETVGENLKVSIQFKPDLQWRLVPDPQITNRLVIVFDDPGAMVTPQDIETKIPVPDLNHERVLNGPLSGKIIVLDPGHGGEDSGACGRQGVIEKDHNLEIALCLKELLEQAGAKVLLTRTGDRYIGLFERSYFTNDVGADLFVSIHTNNHPDLSVHGLEVYSYSGRSVAKTLAQGVLARLGQTTGFKKLGAKEANFVVIRETQIPGILVEVGFLSNYQEEHIMRTPEFKEKAALGIFLGIRDWLKE